MKSYVASRFRIERDESRCIQCQVCVRQCGYHVHAYDSEDGTMSSREADCTACHRCVTLCPTQALSIIETPLAYRGNANWRPEVIQDIIKQAEDRRHVADRHGQR